MEINQYSPLTPTSLGKFKTLIETEYINAYAEDRNFENEKKGKRNECGRYTIPQQAVGVEFIQHIFDSLEVNNKAIFFYDRLRWLPGYLVYKAENKKSH